MAQIVRELDHLQRRVLARAIPVHERSNSEGMAQIMNAGTASMPVEFFRRAQPYGLADDGEVVSGTAVSESFAVFQDKERFWRCTKKPVPFPGISNKPDRGAIGDRQ